MRKFSHLRTTCFLIAVLSFFVARVNAAEIGCRDLNARIGITPPNAAVGACVMGFITGEIDKGDFEKVRSLLAKKHPNLDEFLIRSSGGDAVEAMRIGALFRKYLIKVTGPQGNSKIGFMSPLILSKSDRCWQPHMDCGAQARAP